MLTETESQLHNVERDSRDGDDSNPIIVVGIVEIARVGTMRAHCAATCRAYRHMLSTGKGLWPVDVGTAWRFSTKIGW